MSTKPISEAALKGTAEVIGQLVGKALAIRDAKIAALLERVATLEARCGALSMMQDSKRDLLAPVERRLIALEARLKTMEGTEP